MQTLTALDAASAGAVEYPPAAAASLVCTIRGNIAISGFHYLCHQSPYLSPVRMAFAHHLAGAALDALVNELEAAVRHKWAIDVTGYSLVNEAGDGLDFFAVSAR